jgi:hypothetical protein
VLADTRVCDRVYATAVLVSFVLYHCGTLKVNSFIYKWTYTSEMVSRQFCSR